MADLSTPVVAACVKWIDLRPEVDALTGTVGTESRRFGFSPADRAAVEVALELGDRWGSETWIVSVAPAAAETDLAGLAASGASRVVRVDQPATTGSKRVAASLAAVLADAAVVLCGDMSLDVGSGSVPATLAHHLGASQALGLLEVEAGEPGRVRAVRRLDGGRREHVELSAPAVLSVEGSVARLRRAPVARLVHGGPGIEVVAPVSVPVAHVALHRTTPWRPRTRAVPPPDATAPFGRIVELTGALTDRTPPRRVDLEPDDAAAAIVEQLRTWGYLS